MKALSQPLFASLRGYDKAQLGPDLFSGALIALLSIPISMGYAQLAGLPPVYGLYGSLVPILLFAMLSTTREFIFGVDAAPAAMIGAVVTSLGVTPGSAEAMRVVPVPEPSNFGTCMRMISQQTPLMNPPMTGSEM